MSVENRIIKADWIKKLEKEAMLGEKLVAILSHHCGETGKNEGAVETLKRIIKERDAAKKTHDHA